MPPGVGGPRTEGGGGNERLVKGGGPEEEAEGPIIILGGGPFIGGGPSNPTVSEGTPDGAEPVLRGGLDCLDGRLFDCASNCIRNTFYTLNLENKT